MNIQKKTNQPSIASFFSKTDSSIIKTPKKESEPPSIRVENKEVIKSPSSDSEDKPFALAPTKKSRKRVLSFDESGPDEKSNASNENIKKTPTKAVKQMKIIDTKIEINDEKDSIFTKIEQTTITPIEQKTITDTQSYNPGKTNYDPINDACWKLGSDVPYSSLSTTLLLIEETSARLEIIRILSNFFRSVLSLSSRDLVHCVYLCVNKVAPDYDGIELGIGETIIMKAIADSTGRTVEQLKLDYKSKGDLGLVAEASRSTQRTMFKPKPLTVSLVYKKLKEIAQLTGNKSQQRKGDIIKSLLVSCQSHETRYLVRSLIGKLRIGLAEQSMLVALAHACIRNEYSNLKETTLKEHLDNGTHAVKDAFCQCPSYDILVDALVDKGGIDKLKDLCKATPGIPMKPMLAHPSKGIDEILKRCGQSEFACEYKYDGERAQIHLTDDGKIYIYSRNSENNTSKYPDIIERIPNAFQSNVKSLILDGECVAYDIEQKKLLPFQTLSTRKRKDADIKEIKVQVCIFAFDLLYLNGESLVEKSFRERRRLLHESIVCIPGELVFAESRTTSNIDEINMYLEQSVKDGCEGLMVKTLDDDATYEIAKRSHKWLKLKKDYLDGVGDTLDLVVIGGYTGTGKRTGVYGGYLLACYDKDNEEYQCICKLGTGFTDELLVSLGNSLEPHIIQKPLAYYRYSSSLTPDVWFDAVKVWEVKCADLSLSPHHHAAIGLVDEGKGISLRFPRFLHERQDKSVEDATSAEQVADLYRRQEKIKKIDPDNQADDDDDMY
ncbi:unnamed protein product [Rotaria magnacalcarata]|uniref:DNA ligase n=3 Tax=Rotaria magnacalcarata TaxID=392030 RepID=A0A816N6E4_9BILA|nr:unnamed protein product [Rotaria magnacalcarata]CAF1348751.1 unnamed protein product [Rotaria magnacalcarata]CAF1946886.1 unnamed protein product [Rotaria magnacalcarata]CAF2027777.1 unnamed protein product [Rotaria magnacalcarata]CAF3775637.1 unnamed protein product [Rotaria magnacalcarata]